MSQPRNQQQQNEDLLQYLHQQLPPAEAHKLEKQLLDDPFAQEAVEGLTELGSIAAIQQKVFQLNKALEVKMQKPHTRRRKPLFNQQLPWQILAVLIVIFLCVAGYYLINEYLKHLTR